MKTFKNLIENVQNKDQLLQFCKDSQYELKVQRKDKFEVITFLMRYYDFDLTDSEIEHVAKFLRQGLYKYYFKIT